MKPVPAAAVLKSHPTDLLAGARGEQDPVGVLGGDLTGHRVGVLSAMNAPAALWVMTTRKPISRALARWRVSGPHVGTVNVVGAGVPSGSRCWICAWAGRRRGRR